jgi:uncharacterized protein (DUF2141 family)
MQIRKILLLVLLPLLMSWAPSSLKKNTLEVKVEVVDKDKGHVIIDVLHSVGSCKLEIIGIETTQVFNFSSSSFSVKDLKKGEYVFVVVDSNYHVGSVLVKV